MGVMDKFLNYMKLNEDEEEYETDDDYIDDEEDDYVEPARNLPTRMRKRISLQRKRPLPRLRPYRRIQQSVCRVRAAWRSVYSNPLP